MPKSLNLTRVSAVAAFCLIGLAVPEARADVCVAVDDARDTFPPSDRSAAVLLISKHFELAGERVGPAPCADQYTLSHIRLGDTIAVMLTGPKGRREATAIGLDDLPAVYDQMVRSILTGQPMTLRGVVDRTNVSIAQTAKLRVESDNIFYARLGYGATFADGTYGMPSIGLIGYRRELDSFGIDMSFLNFNMKTDNSYAGDMSGGSYEWLRLEGLYFTNPKAEQTIYFGGGMAYGGTTLSNGSYYDRSYRDWHGSGLSGVLTAGYELPRASTLRVFVQSDLTLPFYSLESAQYGPYIPSVPYKAPTVTTMRHYAPSLAISVGLGWGRGAHARKP
jgi:hypothetical protein